VRFAPSPTGDLHIGGMRTAQFNWMFAHRFGGKFILRIEDTDQKRTKEEALAGILDALRWAGLNWDEGPDIGGPYGPYVQSERTEMYRQWANWLLDNDMAYRTYETPQELDLISEANKGQGYDRRGRSLTRDDWKRLDQEGKPYAIRFKVPALDMETTIVDMVRGPIAFQNSKLQDLVLLKSDGFPTYHLANVIDDHFMEISHVLRAEEWISTAPVHQLLYEAFGWEMPQLAHLPVILAPDGGKLSKRKHPWASMSHFMKGGYLPDAVTNYLCNVGWNYGVTDEQGNEIQIFSKEQAAEIFDVTRVSPSGTKFDYVKLQWLNGERIRLMDTAELAKWLRPELEKAGLQVDERVLLAVTPLVRNRMKLLTDVVDKAGFFFRPELALPPSDALIPKGMNQAQARDALQRVYDTLAALPAFDHQTQETAMRTLADTLGVKLGQLFGAVRVAVTGQTVSPPLFETMEILGRDVALTRIKNAIELLA